MLLSGTVCLLYFIGKNEIAALETTLLTEKTTYPEIYDTLNSISYLNFNAFLADNKDQKLIVYVGRPTCSDCSVFEPVLIDFIKNSNLSNQVIYLNVAQTRKNEAEWEKFKTAHNIIYTPAIAIFEGGKFNTKI